ncbi:MAG: hypothetical protein C5B50_04240 [Verrucomicrobia bacterium]|nr:MAG: hypothetical protein C5B50_04240 [Verrucomicrobiota bacterium]
MKTPNTKHQTPKKFQTPGFKGPLAGATSNGNCCVDRPRSGQPKVAVGFSPRSTVKTTLRRVATLKRWQSVFAPAIKRRYATQAPFALSFRGLKPTATFAASLRDAKLNFRKPLRLAYRFWAVMFFGGCLALPAMRAAETNSDFSEKLPPLEPVHPEIPPGFWENYSVLTLAGSIELFALVAVLVWWLLRPKVVVPAPPAVQARQNLEPLRTRPEDGATLSLISQVLRHYTAAAFALPAQEMTTAEFCRAIAAHNKIGSDLSASMADFLHRCDERKFAPPSPAQPLGAVGQAFGLIDKLEQTRTRTELPAQTNPARPA